jgi:glycosyltransferase involved in cell wall biosynthesis
VTGVTPSRWPVDERAGPVVCVATSTSNPGSESSFILAHIQRLPARIRVLSGLEPPPRSDAGLPVAPTSFERLARAAARRLGVSAAAAQDVAVARHLRRQHVEALLAEYGPMAVRMLPACRWAGIPLIAHFHGYDASVRRVIQSHGGYAELLREAAALVVVSRDMEARLLALGAPREKLHYNPYGVDTSVFTGGDPSRAAPLFAAIGRFVEKKAPELTLLSFLKVWRQLPAARLLMVGDGPLLGPCQRLVQALGLSDAVSLPGALPSSGVIESLLAARAFVQHSVTARDGDSEGMPVAILEACAAGLPVVSTRHAGIKEVVVEGETGFLVDEGDAASMADHMLRLAHDPALAARLGLAGRRRIEACFSMDRSIAGLWAIIEATRARNGGQGP